MKIIYFYRINKFPDNVKFDICKTFIKIGETINLEKRNKRWAKNALINGYDIEKLPFIVKAENDKYIHELLRGELYLQVCLPCNRITSKRKNTLSNEVFIIEVNELKEFLRSKNIEIINI